MEKKKCYNCKFRSRAFKVGNLTHYHCDASIYQQQRAEGKEISPGKRCGNFQTLVKNTKNDENNKRHKISS